MKISFSNGRLTIKRSAPVPSPEPSPAREPEAETSFRAPVSGDFTDYVSMSTYASVTVRSSLPVTEGHQVQYYDASSIASLQSGVPLGIRMAQSTEEGTRAARAAHGRLNAARCNKNSPDR